jgi:hypothetical protein
MKATIQGTTMPVLDVQLDPNESVYSDWPLTGPNSIYAGYWVK